MGRHNSAETAAPKARGTMTDQVNEEAAAAAAEKTPFKRFIVNTSKDLTGSGNSGNGTLRKAIQDANEFYENPRNQKIPYYIDFEASDGYTKSWFIKPEIPLPPILSGNVFINYNNPKFVTITGENLAKPRPKPPSWVKTPKSGVNNQNSSLLTLGTDLYLEKTIPNGKYKYSEFHITNVNFSTNTAKGEDGRNGSGGGMGAGGGISLLSGKAVIENAVFQKLKAQGGYHPEGYSGAAGGKGGYGADWEGRNGSSALVSGLLFAASHRVPPPRMGISPLS